MLNQIERFTREMLLSHPNPRDFLDNSRPLHCFYFMGLSRKQITQAQEAEQFDIRAIVNDFKSSIHAYQHWKEGMEIEVSHVKRKDIPLFVFPGGLRPSRPSKTAGREARTVSRNMVSTDAQAGNVLSDAQSDPLGGYQSLERTPIVTSSLPSEETGHTFNGYANFHAESIEREHLGNYLERTYVPEKLVAHDVVNTPESMAPNSSNICLSPTNGSDSLLDSLHQEPAEIAVNKHTNFSSAVLAVPDELDDLESHQVKVNQRDLNAVDQRFSLKGTAGSNVGQTGTASSHGDNHLKRKAEEELEVTFSSYLNTFLLL